MADMLVKLYDLPDQSSMVNLLPAGVTIQRAMTLDRSSIIRFVDEQFRTTCAAWVDECDSALLRQPTTCFIAIHQRSVIGFCCWDSTAKGMLGPLGVHQDFRGKGIASVLINQSLQAMKSDGYAYAVIGWVSSESFYQKCCGAITIPDSFPGVYSRLLSQQIQY